MRSPSAAVPARRSVRALALVVALLGTLGIPGLGAAHAQQASPLPALDAESRERLRITIRRLLDAAQVASAAVGVARDGEVLWEEGFRHADIARHIRATPATLYSVASISKPITATAVMQLVTQLVTQLVEQLRDGTLRGWAAAQGTAETTDHWLSSHAELTRAPATATAGNR